MVGISSLFLCLVVLTFGSVTDAAVFSPRFRNSTVGVHGSLIIGNMEVRDRLLWTTTANREGINNTIQTEDVVFRGNVGTRIAMLRAIELGSQGAQASLVGGGIYQNSVTIRLRSAVSGGYAYSITIFGDVKTVDCATSIFPARLNDHDNTDKRTIQ